MAAVDNSKIYKSVQDHYSTLANGSTPSNDRRIAEHFGYDAEELNNLPEGANLGLSCGNPIAIATLKPGETVVDLGSGAGFDVFQAARKVGSEGQAIGIDQNDDMLARANKNRDRANLDNVRFIKSPITDIDLPNACADCVISNCVVNLVPEDEKPVVFKEMFRVLKSGGRVAISDVLAKKEMPEHIRNDVALYVGCIAGASQVEQYQTYLRDAGFVDVKILGTDKSINVYKDTEQTGAAFCGTGSCCAPSNKDVVSATKSDVDFDEWAGSFKIFASKAK